ncbi:MAG: flagellar type III secretion system protein FliR [Caulobacteraceae bacterium]|nr:flagellar type III secretion system protein FliR [Caulobacteraceae bacterium]
MEPYATADQVWAGGLIFARIGAIFLSLPGIGESYVPPRIRLSLALVVALALWPVVGSSLPPLPESLGASVGWVIREVIVGLAIGAILRVFVSALAVAGEIVSLQTTLSFAQTTNPLQASPGTTIAAFLMLMGTVLVFATNTHHLFIAGLVGSYELIAPARPLVTGDFTELAVRTVGDAFLLGVQLSAPVIVFALVFNIASGLVGRVMPAFQIFFVAAPLSVILGLSVFALSLGVLGTVFIDRYRDLANLFVSSGGVGG